MLAKKRYWVFLLNIFEEGILRSIVFIIFILIKQSEKMHNEEQNLFKASEKNPHF